MRHGIGTYLVVTAALLAIPVFASGDDYMSRVRRGGSRPAQRGTPFMISGLYSGTIGGDIELDLASYRLITDASVYEVGLGSVAPNTTVTDRVVCLTGIRLNNVNLVYSVILRPASESEPDGGDRSAYITVREGPSPD